MNNEKFAILSEDAIQSLIEKSVQEALKKSLPSVIKRANLPRYISSKTLQELANWSPGKIQYLRDRNEIEYIQQGRTVLYPTEWILDYLEAHKITPRKEVLEELEKRETL